MNKSNWDDIQYILAVAETGSLNAAAIRLGVTHATVLRRVSGFERNHGQPLFQRLATGYRTLPEAEPVLMAARNVRDAVQAVGQAFPGADKSFSGPVRITSTDSLSADVLPPIVKRISLRYPDLEITLLSANTRHDLLLLPADIAIRPALSLDESLSGQIAGYFRFALYQAPETGSKTAQAWLGLDGLLENSSAAHWMRENVDAGDIQHWSDSFLVLREMAAAGMGKVLLPDFVGNSDNRLVRDPEWVQNLTVPIWVAKLKELAGNTRFSAVQTLLADELAKILI
ncbi:MAG: LysR family transcriptional regulator [Paracoccaceae bacterium]